MQQAFAIADPSGTAWKKTESPETPERKQPGFFHHPAKKSPSEQLVYARALRDEGRLRRARNEYLALVCTWHGSPEAPKAQMEYAEVLEKRGEAAEAFDEYQYLIDNFAGSFPYGEVLDRQYRIANQLLTTKSRFLWIFDTSAALETVRPMFEKIVVNGPNGSHAAESQFNVGWIDEQTDSPEQAIAAYEAVCLRYPESEVAANAAFREGFCLYSLAKRDRQDEQAALRARMHLRLLLQKHPDHKDAAATAEHMKELEARLAKLAYERALFYARDSAEHPKAALIAYTDFVNKFPAASQADAARKCIAELKARLAAGDGK